MQILFTPKVWPESDVIATEDLWQALRKISKPGTHYVRRLRAKQKTVRKSAKLETWRVKRPILRETETELCSSYLVAK